MKKAIIESAEIAVSQQIQLDRNQSSSWPRSKMIWSVASQIASSANPAKSTVAALFLRM